MGTYTFAGHSRVGGDRLLLTGGDDTPGVVTHMYRSAGTRLEVGKTVV